MLHLRGLPFKVSVPDDDTGQFLSEEMTMFDEMSVQGMARMGEDGLHLEYKVTQSYFMRSRPAVKSQAGRGLTFALWLGRSLGGLTQMTGQQIYQTTTGELQELTLALDELDTIELKQRLWLTRVIVSANSMRSLDALPGSRQGEVKLKIAFKHRERAADFVRHAQAILGEDRLRRLDS